MVNGRPKYSFQPGLYRLRARANRNRSRKLYCFPNLRWNIWLVNGDGLVILLDACCASLVDIQLLRGQTCADLLS